MTAVELLQQIGLNKYEAEAYYTLLVQGPLTGYELGKRSQVPLSRSYEILERLTQKGLVLVQPGNPPYYAAEEAERFLGQVRSTMTATLDALATSLATLPRSATADEYWVLRGRQHILDRVRSLLADAQQSIDLTLPTESSAEIADVLALARSHGCRVSVSTLNHTSNNTAEYILLLVDGRMALVPAQLLARRQRFRHQAHALIHFHVVADDRGFANHSARAMVHEKVRADLGARMQIHARAAVRPFGHDAREERNVFQIQLVRQPLHRDRFDERIRDDDFLLAERRGIAVEGGLHVGLQQFADARQAAEKFQRQAVRDGAKLAFHVFRWRIVFETLVNLVFERAEHRVEARGGLHLDFRRMNQLIVKKTREQQPQQVLRQRRHQPFGGKVLAVEMIDAADLRVGGDQFFGELRDRRFHARSIRQRKSESKRAEFVKTLNSLNR